MTTLLRRAFSSYLKGKEFAAGFMRPETMHGAMSLNT